MIAQTLYRGRMARVHTTILRKNIKAIIIQAYWRMYTARYKYKHIKESIVLIQRQWKAYRVNNIFALFQQCIIIIIDKLHITRQIKAVTKIQAWYRRKKRELGDKIFQLMKQLEKEKKEKVSKDKELKKLRDEQNSTRIKQEQELKKLREVENKIKAQEIFKMNELRREERERLYMYHEERNMIMIEGRDKEIKRFMEKQQEKEQKLRDEKKAIYHELQKANEIQGQLLRENSREVHEKNRHVKDFGAVMKVNESLIIRLQQILDENDEMKQDRVMRERINNKYGGRKKGFWSFLFD